MSRYQLCPSLLALPHKAYQGCGQQGLHSGNHFELV